jgi:FtsZ-interacting cell division protein ZipA
MSTVLIVVIVVVVVLVVGGLALTRLPKARERARQREAERELGERREQVVDQHREEAVTRDRRAEIAEQRARVAAQEAEREPAGSQLAEEKAKLHERDLADHELIDVDERQRFAGTSATEPLLDEGPSAPNSLSRDELDRAKGGAVSARADRRSDQGTRQGPVDEEETDLPGSHTTGLRGWSRSHMPPAG